jgi:hypothetical protein
MTFHGRYRLRIDHPDPRRLIYLPDSHLVLQQARSYVGGLVRDWERGNKDPRLDALRSLSRQLQWLSITATDFSREKEVILYTPRPVKATVVAEL